MRFFAESLFQELDHIDELNGPVVSKIEDLAKVSSEKKEKCRHAKRGVWQTFNHGDKKNGKTTYWLSKEESEAILGAPRKSIIGTLTPPPQDMSQAPVSADRNTLKSWLDVK